MSMNKYNCITNKNDTPDADVGSLYSIVEKVNIYLLDDQDEEMRRWLDPEYIVIDWTNSALAFPYPNLTNLAPPLSATIPLGMTAQTDCYVVPNREDGHFLLGILIQRFPGCMGVLFSTPTSVVFRT